MVVKEHKSDALQQAWHTLSFGSPFINGPSPLRASESHKPVFCYLLGLVNIYEESFYPHMSCCGASFTKAITKKRVNMKHFYTVLSMLAAGEDGVGNKKQEGIRVWKLVYIKNRTTQIGFVQCGFIKILRANKAVAKGIRAIAYFVYGPLFYRAAG